MPLQQLRQRLSKKNLGSSSTSLGVDTTATSSGKNGKKSKKHKKSSSNITTNISNKAPVTTTTTASTTSPLTMTTSEPRVLQKDTTNNTSMSTVPSTIVHENCSMSACSNSSLEETYSRLKAEQRRQQGQSSSPLRDKLANATLSPTGSQIQEEKMILQSSNHESTTHENDDLSSKGPRMAMSANEVKKDESKVKKVAIRLASGISMVLIFLSFLFSGHIHLCGLIFFTEVVLFRELVKVRYNTFFHIIEETIPLFRTTQWMWFVTSIFYTSSDFVIEVIKSNTSLHYLLDYARLMPGFSFILYSATFVLTIATMHKDHIRFQLNQLCWTVLVLCLTVGQLRYIMHNVYNGLIWFALPIMLVVCNDSFAWLSGITCGRKFIQRDFISLSPNKTWEGFIGGWIGTMVWAWYMAYYMAQYTWMTCPNNDFSLFPGPLECELDPIFHEATYFFPPQVFEVFPKALVQMIPNMVNICMVDGDPNDLTACVSGEASHSHHHFEMIMKIYPIQFHALGLSLFASFVAPFGGFLASAIKRAYGIKDFGCVLPGHGGMMDRMDCQFLMALCTWVHYNTFVKMATISVPKMIYMYKLLKESEQEEFLAMITELSNNGTLQG